MRWKVIFGSLILGLFIILEFQEPIFPQKENVNLIEVKETLGRVEAKIGKELKISLPKGNIVLTPVYDESMIEEMSQRITRDVLITEETNIFSQMKNKPVNFQEINVGDTIIIRTKEDISKNDRLTAEAIIILGHYKIEERPENKNK